MSDDYWPQGFYYCMYTNEVYEFICYWSFSLRGILLKDQKGRYTKCLEREKPWLEYIACPFKTKGGSGEM